MEEIKVGEYIRDNTGDIGKVIEVNSNYYRKDDGFKVWRHSFREIKHSKNIIDLIEVRRLCEWTKNNKNNTRPFYKKSN